MATITYTLTSAGATGSVQIPWHTSSAVMECIGSGGGGQLNSGGPGGAYSKKTLTNLAWGSLLYYNVATSSAINTAGSSSWVATTNSVSSAVCRAIGGGESASNIGDVTFSGGSGGSGGGPSTSSPNGPGGGGGGGSTSNGTSGAQGGPFGRTGGSGGTGSPSGGTGGTGALGPSGPTGTAGSFPGGGGGGGVQYQDFTQPFPWPTYTVNGGASGSGYVRITFTVSDIIPDNAILGI